ncbi:MAG: NUDIX pyrophosphatase [Gemmatimonadales bacterium]
MTRIRVSIVDVYVLKSHGQGQELLLLRRGPGGRCPGSWETVHGHVEETELPADAALRELREETGLVPDRLYNLSRAELFYQHRSNEVSVIPVFAAFVPLEAEVTLGPEHDALRWVPVAEGTRRFSWPRERRAVEDLLMLFGSGDAGPVEDVLRVIP